MQVQFLYGAQITSKEQLHQLFAERFSFPDYYGANLDALWDCLTDLSVPVELILVDKNALCENLPDYGSRFLRLLEDLSRENPDFCVRYK